MIEPARHTKIALLNACSTQGPEQVDKQTMVNFKAKHIQESGYIRKGNVCWYGIWLNTTLYGSLLRDWDTKGLQYFFV